jgi:antitoxin ParD1/3/4
MPSRAINVDLPEDVVARLEARVTSGEFASESAVIQEGLRVLDARDTAFEGWLHTEVVESFDEYKANPSIGIPAAEVSAGLDARLAAYLERPRRE